MAAWWSISSAAWTIHRKQNQQHRPNGGKGRACVFDGAPVKLGPESSRQSVGNRPGQSRDRSETRCPRPMRLFDGIQHHRPVTASSRSFARAGLVVVELHLVEVNLVPDRTQLSHPCGR